MRCAHASIPHTSKGPLFCYFTANNLNSPSLEPFTTLDVYASLSVALRILWPSCPRELVVRRRSERVSHVRVAEWLTDGWRGEGKERRRVRCGGEGRAAGIVAAGTAARHCGVERARRPRQATATATRPRSTTAHGCFVILSETSHYASY